MDILFEFVNLYVVLPYHLMYNIYSIYVIYLERDKLVKILKILNKLTETQLNYQTYSVLKIY